MTHTEAQLLVPDYCKGRLTPEEETLMRTHMADCADCRGLADAYRLLGAALRDESEHADAAQLVAHAMGTELRPEVERHLSACPACAQQAAAIRAAEVQVTRRRLPLNTWTAWAAAVALPLFLGYFGWMELSVLPGMRQALERAEDGANPAPETVALPLLSSTTRGDEEPVAVLVRPGQRTIAVAVAPALPRDLPDGEVLRIDIRAPGGERLYSRAASVGEIRKLSGKSGAFALVLPAAVLPAGDATLYIHAASRGELFATPFRVRRE